METLVGK